jgi:hypothetical protein
MPRLPNKNRVPNGGYNINDNDRRVYIISRFCGGPAVAWGANIGIGIVGGLFGIGAAAVPYPNPSYHWAICVGDWYHQLQATDGRNWYENDKYDWTGGWKSVDIGYTKYNDVAIVSAGTF